MAALYLQTSFRHLLLFSDIKQSGRVGTSVVVLMMDTSENSLVNVAVQSTEKSHWPYAYG